MSKATITFQDGGGDGQFRVDTDYGEGGFQASSHAHQHAMLCIKALNVMAQRLGMEAGETQVVGSDAGMIDAIGEQMAAPLPPSLADAVMEAIQVRVSDDDNGQPIQPGAIEIVSATSPFARPALNGS